MDIQQLIAIDSHSFVHRCLHSTKLVAQAYLGKYLQGSDSSSTRGEAPNPKSGLARLYGLLMLIKCPSKPLVACPAHRPGTKRPAAAVVEPVAPVQNAVPVVDDNDEDEFADPCFDLPALANGMQRTMLQSPTRPVAVAPPPPTAAAGGLHPVQLLEEDLRVQRTQGPRRPLFSCVSSPTGRKTPFRGVDQRGLGAASAPDPASRKRLRFD